MPANSWRLDLRPNFWRGGFAAAALALRGLLPGALTAIAAVLLAACSGPELRVELPRAKAPSRPASLRAAAAEVDITPPPGAPLWGYAIGSAAKQAIGYRTRLKARVLLLEGPRGGRFALVQTDLGAPSRLLHRRVAAELVEQGISADRLMLSATHTHAAPGGYFGNLFYNLFGAGKRGFDEALVEFLVDRLSRGIKDAAAELAPAVLGARTVAVPGATHNRSPRAFERNVCPGCGGQRIDPVDDRLVLLRVDTKTGGGTHPLAAFAVFAVHGTAVSKANELYHGDVLGYASRYLAGFVHDRHRTGARFVAAVANGAEGDVSPTKDRQSFRAAERVGRFIAERAFSAYQKLDGELDGNVDLSHAYREPPMADLHTVAGDVCDRPVIGLPTMAGAEDGRSSFAGKLIREGRRRTPPRGCQAYKLPALSTAVQKVILRKYRSTEAPGGMPTIAPFQVLVLYSANASADELPLLVLAAVPGEPTTAVGFEIKHRVADVFGGPKPLPADRIAVVGLANNYLGYFTSTAEYAAQHYEGGATFFGPLQGLAAVEQLEAAARRARDEIYRRSTCDARGRCETLQEPSSRTMVFKTSVHRPGRRRSFFGDSVDCAKHEAEWEAGAVSHDPKGRWVEFSWEGLDDAHFCAPPEVRILCGGAPLADRFGRPETDDGLRFEVRRKNGEDWTAYFFPTAKQRGRSGCVFEVARSSGNPVTSSEFSL